MIANEMTLLRRWLFAISILVVSSAVSALEIDIGGVRLGMTKEEFQQKFGAMPVKTFVVFGISSKWGITDADFVDGRLARFVTFFEQKDFPALLAALRPSMPILDCVQGPLVLENIHQVVCRLEDSDAVFSMSRFQGFSEPSPLSMYTKKWMQAQRDESIRKSKEREEALRKAKEQ